MFMAVSRAVMVAVTGSVGLWRCAMMVVSRTIVSRAVVALVAAVTRTIVVVVARAVVAIVIARTVMVVAMVSTVAGALASVTGAARRTGRAVSGGSRTVITVVVVVIAATGLKYGAAEDTAKQQHAYGT